MLVAELHGHYVAEAQNSEDYLTSTVFGHLRYLLPNLFWPELFKHILAMPAAGPRTLFDQLAQSGISIKTFDSLDIHFWPSHPTFGCPDLILVFSGKGLKPLVVLVEAKLWAEKSGTGDFDQIVRYLRLLNQPARVHPRLPTEFTSALIYLTERDSLAELEESLKVFEKPIEGRRKIFRLQWQDIIMAASVVLPSTAGIARLILNDVASFLTRRGLKYFSGFHRLDFPAISIQPLNMLKQEIFEYMPLPGLLQIKALPIAQHSTFRKLPLPPVFNIQRGPWL